jgi:hypothetical protein
MVTSGSSLPSLRGSAEQTRQQADHKKDEEHEEEDLRNTSESARDPDKPKYAGEQR